MKIDNSNIENRNPLQCLHELMDARLIMVEWEFKPLSDDTTEIIRLFIKKPKSSSATETIIAVEETRDIHLISKSNVKHYLGEVALERLIGDDWSDMTVTQMKAVLTYHELSWILNSRRSSQGR